MFKKKLLVNETLKLILQTIISQSYLRKVQFDLNMSLEKYTTFFTVH